MKTLPTRAMYVGVLVCAMSSMMAGCEGLPGGNSASASTTAKGASVQATGLLTLKGPEMGAWWALTDASGVVWRLESSNPEQVAQWRQWQNRRIQVQGVTDGAYLATTRLQVMKSVLKAE
jgi:transcriptional regulator GlxA family with amidase domain